MAMSSELRSRLENGNRTNISKRENQPFRTRWLDHLAHAGVCHLTSHESHIMDAGDMDIRDEHATSMQVPGILLPQQTGANPTSVPLRTIQFSAPCIRLRHIVCDNPTERHNRHLLGGPHVSKIDRFRVSRQVYAY